MLLNFLLHNVTLLVDLLLLYQVFLVNPKPSAFTSSNFIYTPPKPAPNTPLKNGIIESFKFTANIAGSETPTNVGTKLDTAISFNFDFFLANKNIPIQAPP